MTELIIMTQKELSRYEIIKRLIRKEINGTGAAQQLDLSVRQTNVMEKMRDLHQITLSKETVRQLMIELELWQPRSRKRSGDYRSWRERKDYYGEMEQFDGCYFD